MDVGEYKNTGRFSKTDEKKKTFLIYFGKSFAMIESDHRS